MNAAPGGSGPGRGRGRGLVGNRSVWRGGRGRGGRGRGRGRGGGGGGNPANPANPNGFMNFVPAGRRTKVSTQAMPFHVTKAVFFLAVLIVHQAEWLQMQKDYTSARRRHFVTLYKAETLHDIHMLAKPWMRTDDDTSSDEDNSDDEDNGNPFDDQMFLDDVDHEQQSKPKQEHTLEWLEQYARTYLNGFARASVLGSITSGELLKTKTLRGWREVCSSTDQRDTTMLIAVTGYRPGDATTERIDRDHE